MKRVRRQKNKSARIKFKQKRNAIIIVIIALCLLAIYGFNLWTKSEVLKTTAVKFVEYATGREIVQEIEVHMEEYDDETKYYIYLPEDVNGYNIKKFINTKQDVSMNDVNDLEKQEDDNIYSENKSDSLFESVINTDAQKNINTVEDNEVNKNITVDNTLSENTNTTVDNIVSENTNTTVDNTVSENTNTTVDNTVSENTNTTVDNTVNENINATVDNTVNENTNATVDNTVNENTNITVDNTVNEDTDTTINNTVNDNTNTVVDNTEIDNTNTIKDLENVNFEAGETLPGEKIYLSKEDVLNDTIKVDVELDVKIFDETRLYKRELNYKEGNAKVNVKGYIPFEYGLVVEAEDIKEMEELTSDIDELKESEVLAAYDIKLIKEDDEYQPIKYNEVLDVSITSAEAFQDKLIGKEVKVIHVNENVDEIVFEKMEVSEKTQDSITCRANEFSKYLVVVDPVISNDYVILNDYERDYNYYIGKNFTDTKTKTSTNKYNDDNLAKVTVNYYSFDPTFDENAIIHPNSVTLTGNSVESNNTHNTYNVVLEARFTDDAWVDENRGWTAKINISSANRFNLAQTQSLAQNANFDITFDGNATVTIQNKANNANWNSWTKVDGTTYRLTFRLYYNNRDSVNFSNPSTDRITGYKKELKGYIGPGSSERQSRMTYTKAVPISNGKISFELIDNPFMDRPTDSGFDGWNIDNDIYSSTISMDSDTCVQTITSTIGNNKDVTINFYPNWRRATVIYIDSNTGNNNDSGLTPDLAVDDWAGLRTAFNGKYKDASNASDRELNIVFLYGGTLDNVMSGTNNQKLTSAYTITSYYNGVDRRTNATLNIDADRTLERDLQIEYVRTSGNHTFAVRDRNGYSDGSGEYEDHNRIIGGGYNFRIGRGLTLENANNATVVQLFGGLVANKQATSRSYRFVIESGRYNNIQCGRGADATYTSNATLIAGCDYDRAIGDNDNLEVFVKLSARTSSGTIYPKDTSKPIYDMYIKSGTIGRGLFDINTDPYAGIYVGAHGTQGTDRGARHLTVEGGIIANITGGLSSRQNYLVDTRVYVMGGEVQQVIGGAGYTTTYGSKILQITDGDIVNSVNGGSNGYEASGGNNNGNCDADVFVYVGGNAEIGTRVRQAPTGAYPTLYGTESGCVLSAGNGNQSQPSGRKS